MIKNETTYVGDKIIVIKNKNIKPTKRFMYIDGRPTL